MPDFTLANFPGEAGEFWLAHAKKVFECAHRVTIKSSGTAAYIPAGYIAMPYVHAVVRPSSKEGDAVQSAHSYVGAVVVPVLAGCLHNKLSVEVLKLAATPLLDHFGQNGSKQPWAIFAKSFTTFFEDLNIK